MTERTEQFKNKNISMKTGSVVFVCGWLKTERLLVYCWRHHFLTLVSFNVELDVGLFDCCVTCVIVNCMSNETWQLACVRLLDW